MLPFMIPYCIQSTFSGSISFWKHSWWAAWTLFFPAFRRRLRLLCCDLSKMIQWGRSASHTLFLVPSPTLFWRMCPVAGSLHASHNLLSALCSAGVPGWVQAALPSNILSPTTVKGLTETMEMCRITEKSKLFLKVSYTKWDDKIDVQASGVAKEAEPSNRSHLDQQVTTRLLSHAWYSGEYKGAGVSLSFGGMIDSITSPGLCFHYCCL